MNNRNQTIDVLKGIMILAVILGISQELLVIHRIIMLYFCYVIRGICFAL